MFSLKQHGLLCFFFTILFSSSKDNCFFLRRRTWRKFAARFARNCPASQRKSPRLRERRGRMWRKCRFVGQKIFNNWRGKGLDFTEVCQRALSHQVQRLFTPSPTPYYTKSNACSHQVQRLFTSSITLCMLKTHSWCFFDRAQEKRPNGVMYVSSLSVVIIVIVVVSQIPNIWSEIFGQKRCVFRELGGNYCRVLKGAW